MKPHLSIVVPSRGRSAQLRKLFDHLSRQDQPLRLLTGVTQPTLNEQLVEPGPSHQSALTVSERLIASINFR